MKRFMDNYCKIVYKQAGNQKKAVIEDIIDFNDAGFIVFENREGVHYLNSRNIILIKPREKKHGC